MSSPFPLLKALWGRSPSLASPFTLRAVTQWAFLLWCVGMGVRLGLFLSQAGAGEVPAVARPAGVDGFLPVGSLVALRGWVESGVFDPFHPAGIVLLLTFLGMSLLARRSFCSFVCPVGTISEWLWRGGEKAWGKGLRPSGRVLRWLDILLRSLKYALLAGFIGLVFVQMAPREVRDFLSGDYWMLSDVKMGRFFLHLSPLAWGILAGLVGLSLLVRNFWCRYLCPYGALTGLLSLLSPWAVRRDEGICTRCGACVKACPSFLPVMDRRVVRSAECTGCVACVDRCPVPGALRMALPWGRALPGWVFPICVLALFFAGVGAGMATGHWQTSLTPEDYRRLLPQLGLFSH